MTQQSRSLFATKHRIFVAILLNIVGFLLVFSANILISQLLGAAAFGDYSVVIAATILISTIALFGFDKQSLQKIPIFRKKQQTEVLAQYVSSGLIAIFLTSTVILLLGYLLVFSYRLFYPPIFNPTVYILFLFPLYSFIAYLQNLLFADRHFFSSILPHKLLFPIILSTMVTLFYLGFGLASIFSAVMATVVAAVLVLLIYSIYTYRYIVSSFNFKAIKLKPFYWMNNSSPYLIHSIIVMLITNTGIVLVDLLDSSESNVGIYAAITTCSNVFYIIQSGVLLVISPKIALYIHEKNHTKIQKQLGLYFAVNLVFGTIIAAIYIVWGKNILHFFGEEFVEGYTTLIYILPAYLFQSIFGVVLIILQYKSQHTIVAQAYSLMLVVFLLLNIILIPLYGIVGAAFAFSIANALLYLSLTVYVYVYYRLKIFSW